MVKLSHPWHHHGSKENQDYPRLGHSKTSKGYPIVPWFREFLSAIYQGVLRQGMSFEWTLSAQHIFDLLKEVFTNALVLLHIDPTKRFQVETDASDFAIGAILSQPDDDGILHLVAYYSQKFTTSKINYLIYDKELAAIVATFTEWRPYLVGAQHRVQVINDHKHLLYFSTTHSLNRRQARWSTFFIDYDFEIVFRPGAQNMKVGAPS